jgi:hypothetical protein
MRFVNSAPEDDGGELASCGIRALAPVVFNPGSGRNPLRTFPNVGFFNFRINSPFVTGFCSPCRFAGYEK